MAHAPHQTRGVRTSLDFLGAGGNVRGHLDRYEHRAASALLAGVEVSHVLDGAFVGQGDVLRHDHRHPGSGDDVRSGAWRPRSNASLALMYRTHTLQPFPVLNPRTVELAVSLAKPFPDIF